MAIYKGDPFIIGDYKYSPRLSSWDIAVTGATSCRTTVGGVTDQINQTHIYFTIGGYTHTFTMGVPRTVSGQPANTKIEFLWNSTYPTSYSINVYNNTGSTIQAITDWHDCYAEVVDKTKSAYATLPYIVSNNGENYVVLRASECYSGCTNLTTPPTFTDGLYLIDDAFVGCTSLVSSPTIPSSVVTSSRCFKGCTSLKKGASIPAIDRYVDNMFENCTSLKGSVIVNGVPTGKWADIFTGTQKDIYLVNGAGTNEVETFWKSIANEYSNVHYEADDNPAPDITVATPLRVASSGSKVTSAIGTYAYIKANVILYNLIPDDWHNILGTKTLTDNGTAVSPTWTVNNAWKLTADTDIYTNKYYYTLAITTVATPDVTNIDDYYELSNGVYSKTNDLAIDQGKTYYTIVATQVTTPVLANIGTYYEVYLNRYTLECWVNTGDLSVHTFTLSVADNITDSTDTTVASNTSTTLTFVLTKAYKIIDFYHDPNTNTEGVAIGKFAESADLFEVEMNTELNANVYIGLPDYQTADTTDKAIYDNIVALGWDSDVLS